MFSLVSTKFLSVYIYLKYQEFVLFFMLPNMSWKYSLTNSILRIISGMYNLFLYQKSFLSFLIICDLSLTPPLVIKTQTM